MCIKTKSGQIKTWLCDFPLYPFGKFEFSFFWGHLTCFKKEKIYISLTLI